MKISRSDNNGTEKSTDIANYTKDLIGDIKNLKSHLSAKIICGGGYNLEPIIIIGLTPQGLFLLREFGNMGLPIYALAKKEEAGIYSKYGNIFIMDSKKDFVSNIEKFITSIDAHGNKPRCYIAGGVFLKLIIEKYPELFRRMNIKPSPLKALNILTKKTSTYRLANSFGIRTPNTRSLMELLENKNLLNDMNLPLIAKWNEIPVDIFRPKKIWLIREKKDLIEIGKCTNEDHKKSLIVQEFIGKSFESSISYGGYYVNGKEKAGIIVKQIRQYPSGISSYVKEYAGKFSNQARNQATQIIQKLNFSGFCEFEYRICDKTDKLYLIETNPRPWGWIKILKLKYPQFEELLKYPDDPSPLTSVNNNCKWFNIQRDFRGIFNTFSKNKNIIDLLNAINSYRSQKIFDLLDFNDFHPFLSQAKKTFILIVNKDNNKNVEVI